MLTGTSGRLIATRLPVRSTVTTPITEGRRKKGQPRSRRNIAWMRDAACQDTNTDLWFGAYRETKRERLQREEAAKRICASCPVLELCEAYATRTGQASGIWAGRNLG